MLAVRKLIPMIWVRQRHFLWPQTIPAESNNKTLKRVKTGEGNEGQDEPQMIKKGVDTHPAVCQTDTYITFCVSLELIFTIQTLYILSSIKSVNLHANFSVCQCSAINCFMPFIRPWNKTWRKMVSVLSSNTLALRKLVCKQRHASKISNHSKCEEWLLFL